MTAKIDNENYVFDISLWDVVDLEKISKKIKD